MTNACGFGTKRRPTGWTAWIRLYHHAQNRVLRHGEADIIFRTEAEAEAAAKKEFFKHMNSPIVSEAITGPTTKKSAAKVAANRLFMGGGKTVEVTRKEGRA